MATYRPLAGSARAVQEPLLQQQQQQQQRQQSDAGDSFNGNGGVRKEWWWQPGPVDSCCCCCSLRAGVGLLAMDALLTGIWTIFYFRAFYTFILAVFRVAWHDMYTLHCVYSINPPQCEQVKEMAEQFKGLNSVLLHLPTSLYVQAALGVLAGVIGLWAVFFRSRRAAKIYMLSWPARAVVSVWGALEMRSLYIKYGADQGHAGIVHFISFIFCIYYFKVSWSYYKQRVAHDKAQAESRDPSSDTDDDATPMLAMNTIV